MRRPVLTAFFGSTVLTAFTIGLLYLWLRPPYAVRQFDLGLSLQKMGKYQVALECFDRVLESEPKHRDALYERARTYLLLDELPAAASDFSHLATNFGDPRSAAYVGYCFNLWGMHAAAIEWYERSLKDGFETVGLHNNLGASFLGRSKLGDSDGLAKSEYHLMEALKLDANQPIVRGNLVTMALMRSAQDSGFRPEFAVEHLEFLRRAYPDDSRVLTDAVKLYGTLSMNDRSYVKQCITAIKASLRAGMGPTAQELSSNPTFEAVRHRDPSFANLILVAGNSASQSSKSALVKFVDPVVSYGPSAEPR